MQICMLTVACFQHVVVVGPRHTFTMMFATLYANATMRNRHECEAPFQKKSAAAHMAVIRNKPAFLRTRLPNKDCIRWDATGVQDRRVSFGVLYFGRRMENRKNHDLDLALWPLFPCTGKCALIHYLLMVQTLSVVCRHCSVSLGPSEF